jgi:hypothetical protein
MAWPILSRKQYQIPSRRAFFLIDRSHAREPAASKGVKLLAGRAGRATRVPPADRRNAMPTSNANDIIVAETIPRIENHDCLGAIFVSRTNTTQLFL